ncbi:hypothetical protein MBM_05976 [Drepanopeziza brunnea f. sp. 'multigermtubi' MB_m1]|uniref:Polyprotein n=1 Tax=Marssonina brunnea f. sp. multigermtubi (strain MB_m1) TaxID=1072389 RepID=K1WER6_MARBU|nr:uncharacterized protein MBM_05976 [Drepanopeziza brunnea f. sp. 'multigermtubi' MB_m1]EKD15965.1 hypothetical protein MBM_05976 [Drepanopeziza brunnea f. sp. 'multigermtubi' MB_m1]
MTDEEETEEISKEIEDTDTERDLKKVRPITGNYIGNPLPIRPLAKHGTLAYGTLSAFNDNNNDFLELRATDPYLKAKKLALFARSFLKELKYSRPDDNFKTQLTYKNVLEITIVRINPAFTFTAAVANIRRAIAFATKTSRPPAKARAYASFSELYDHTCFHNTLKADSDLNEKYECFIQDRQYFGGKKAAKAIKGFVTTYGTFNANEVYKQLKIQTAFYALTSQIETQNVLTSKAKTYIAFKYFENVFISLMINSGAANFSTASLP